MACVRFFIPGLTDGSGAVVQYTEIIAPSAKPLSVMDSKYNHINGC